MPGVEDGAQLEGRIGIGPVDPDADVLDDRGVLGLAQVRGAGEQDEGAIGIEIEALEEDIAEGVVAGQVEHALLTEDEQPVEAAGLQRVAGGLAPASEFLAGEMQRHAYSSRAISEMLRP